MKKLLIAVALVITAVLCWQNLGLSLSIDEQPHAERVTSRTGLTI